MNTVFYTLDTEITKDDVSSLSSSKDCSENIRLYIKDVESTSRISEEELNCLFFRMNNGDETAKNQIVEANLRLVMFFALKYYKFLRMDLEDLIQEGNIGLIEAIDKFDCEKGFRFSTFAAAYIKGRMLRANAQKSRVIRLPVFAHAQLMDIEQTSANLYKQSGRHVELAELSDATGLSVNQIAKLLPYASSPVSLDSTYVTVDEEEEMPVFSSLIGSLEDPDDPFEKIFRDDFEERIMRLFNRYLSTLLPREKQVLLHYLNGMNLEQISKKMNLPTEMARQKLAKALRKFKHFH